jgi:hypothetical protein
MALILGMNGQCVNAQPDATRRALAEELLNEMHMKETLEKSFAMMKKMMPQMRKSQMASLESNTPPGENKPDVKEMKEKANQFANQFAENMFDQMAQEMAWDNMKDDYITLYAETFTEEELKGLVAFYKTPVGQAFVKKQPEVMKRSMELTQKRMVQWMPKMQELMKGAMGPENPSMKKAAPPIATPPVPPAPIATPPVPPAVKK